MPVFVEVDTTERRPRHVAIGGIPLEITLKKNNSVAAGLQRMGQRAISSRVPIAPGRRNREAANNDLQVRPLRNRLFERARSLLLANRRLQRLIN
jgi:hypothetical protein